MTVRIFLLVLVLLAGTAGGAVDGLPGPIPARVTEVIDGDTLQVRARIWLGQEVETRVRLDGVDTPELSGGCEESRRLALRARDFVRALAADGRVILSRVSYGKYAGRVLARVRAPGGGDFSEALISAGLARPYGGGRRRSWCPLSKSRAD